jgi:hypothetical protein
MERKDSPRTLQCWVDVYAADYFRGKMRRLFGPQKLRQLSAKSVIVGPHAMVVLTVRRAGKDVLVKLPPRKAIPSLASTVRGAKIRNAAVVVKM